LKHGDRNTSFFQNYASKCKRKNTIKGLADHNRTIQEDGVTMCSIVQDYFGNLFTSELGEPHPAILADVQRYVTQDMNTGLLAPFSYEEVKKALFQIGDLKAPGPDGLHVVFFKRFWNLLGDDLVAEVLEVVNRCKVPDSWNDTTIVLIPR